MSSEIKQIRQQTIYTMRDYESARTFANENGGILSSPANGVYEVIVENVIYEERIA